MDSLTPNARATFLEALRETCNVTRAAEAAGVSRQTIYNWREKDPEFEAQVKAAKVKAVEALEDEAHRRAFEGIEEPIVSPRHGVIGYTRVYSDRLAEFLLKAHAPQKYRERTSLELTGKDGGPVQLDVAQREARLAQIVATAAARQRQAEEDGTDLA